jgi:lipoate-protein ligase A
VLRIGREKLSDKGTTSAAKRVDPLRSQTGLPRAAVIERMIATFRRLHGLTDDTLRADELARAEALAQTRFGSATWLADVP